MNKLILALLVVGCLTFLMPTATDAQRCVAGGGGCRCKLGGCSPWENDRGRCSGYFCRRWRRCCPGYPG